MLKLTGRLCKQVFAVSRCAIMVMFLGSLFPVHALVWVGRDAFPEPGHPPGYALYLKGAEPTEIEFAGERLTHRYVAGCRCSQVYGVGHLRQEPAASWIGIGLRSSSTAT